MKRIYKLFAVFLFASAILCNLCLRAAAEEDYPTNPIKVIIPYAPGGGSDILTRTIMKYIKLPNNQNLVAVNIDGAGGMVGAMTGLNSPNNGYTILTHNPMDVASYSLGGQTSIPLWKELQTICWVVDDYNVIDTNKQSGWKTIEELIAYAKAHPKEVKWGVTGAQTVNMADTLRLVKALGLTDYVTIVPYDGGAASRNALLGNHIQVETNSNADIRSALESGDAVPLLVINSERVKSLPGVPTTLEKGIKVTTSKPRGFYAPKGTPDYMVKTIAEAIKTVVESDEFINLVQGLGWDAHFVYAEDAMPRVSGWVEELSPVFAEISDTQN